MNVQTIRKSTTKSRILKLELAVAALTEENHRLMEWISKQLSASTQTWQSIAADQTNRLVELRQDLLHDLKAEHGHEMSATTDKAISCSKDAIRCEQAAQKCERIVQDLQND